MIDGVFGYVDEEEGEHVGKEKGRGAVKIVEECIFRLVVRKGGGGGTRRMRGVGF